MRYIQDVKRLCALTQLHAKAKSINQTNHYRENNSIMVRLYTVSAKYFAKAKEEKEPKGKDNATKIKKTVINNKNQLSEYLADCPGFHELKDLLPVTILSEKRPDPKALYLINKDTAPEILIPILPYLRTESTINSKLIEINPGLGILTELLLENWTRKITLYEHMRKFSKPLNSILENNRGRLNIKQCHFYDLWRYAHQDKYDNGTRIKDLFNVEPKPWGPEFTTTIIGSCPPLSFMKHVIHSFIFRYSLMMLGRHQMFFIVTPDLYIHLTCNKEAGYRMYRFSSIMFQILFEFEFLCKLSRKSFLPWSHSQRVSKKNTSVQKFRDLDKEFLYLMRIEPRVDIFEKLATSDFKLLWYFIKHNCLSRSSRVIPNLERFIPNCGQRLITNPPPSKIVPPRKTMEVNGLKIALESTELYDTDYYQNMTIYTEFGELTPRQIFTLFKQFRSWPEFSESNFITSMEAVLLRLEMGDDFMYGGDEDKDSLKKMQDV